MMRNLRELTTTHASPGVQLLHGTGTSRSHFRGTPELAASAAWPSRGGRPLDFLARVSLPELQRAHAVPWLPSSGALLFFYDTDAAPWGFDPADADGSAVMLVPDLAAPRTGPSIEFRAVATFPGAERDEIDRLNLADDEWDEYDAICNAAFRGATRHQIGGFPLAVQNDTMELECQLASNGLYCGDATGYEDPRAKELMDGAKDWRLLLQIDSDDDLDFMWGDLGRIYFWVREQAARAGDFSGVWTILQCG